LSTADAALALGVSVSTVKRWVDDAILPAHKTAGGHRKILLADLLRLGRDGRLPNADVTRLTLLSPEIVDTDVSRLQAELKTVLHNGRMGEVRALLLRAYQGGLEISELFDDVVLPTLGQLSAMGANPGERHRAQLAQQECRAALYELKGILELRACRHCPVAVGGSLAGDFDPLGSLMCQLVLLDAAWEPINLGPNTPIESFRDAISELRPRILWVTVGSLADRESLVEQYNEMYEQAKRQNVPVLLHGQGLEESLRREMSYTSHADRFEHVVAFARTLHPAPPIPRRGRPTSRAQGA
jgi:excisionase family DNA binding protein